MENLGEMARAPGVQSAVPQLSPGQEWDFETDAGDDVALWW